MTEQKPKSNDSTATAIPCECGNEDHKAGLIVGKFGSLIGSEPHKVKIQIFEGEEIKSVVIKLSDLEKKLGELKDELK